MYRLALPVAIVVAATTGCASTAYHIPKKDLMALAQTPPAERGKHVRVIQGLGSEDAPPEAPHAHAGVAVIVEEPIWVGGAPRYRHRAEPVVDHRTGPGPQLGGSDLAKAKKDDAKEWLVVAAVVAGALALTEGMRYDGWAELSPMHPVHLYGPGGEYTWMPLADVTPDVAAWADKAVVDETQGPWKPLGRAPLDRQGFTYSLLLGDSEISLMGDDPRAGFMGHIQLGFYPIHPVGLQLDIAMGWADDSAGNTVFDGRYGLEVDALPLEAGIFKAGGFGEIGMSSRSDDGIQLDDRSSLLSAGALLQLGLTTRLALTLRAAETWVYGDSLSELCAGVSIY